MLNLKPLLSQLTIKTKTLDYRNLDLDYVDPDPEIGDFGWAQRPLVAEIERQYNEGKPVRNLILKARQLGLSTVTEGVNFLWMFIHPGSNGLVMTHENKQSLELFEMTKLYWDTWPFRDLYSLKYATKQTLQWVETRSRLSIGTAANVKSGRGSTYHAVHMSEAAFYPNPEEMYLGLNQTIPHKHGTIVTIESTANGMGGWFYDFWVEATEGGNDFTPLFFPWFKHSEYRYHTTLNIKSELNAEERQLLRIGATYENIAWRRWAIPNRAHGDLAFFMQEYPSTPDEAFITTGRPIFSHLHLRVCYDQKPGVTGRLMDDPRGKPVFVKDPSGPLTIYKAPKKGDDRWDRYFIAGDPSETIQGDPGCMQVINRQTLEQVAVYHNRITPVHFGKEMIRLGRFYNDCYLCPEVEGGGQATVATLLNFNYPHIWLDKRADKIGENFNVWGWSTNYQRKHWAIGVLQRLVLDRSITIHDVKTYNQLRNYVELDNGEWGNSSPKDHDDAVMALAIAVTASDTEGPFVADSRMSGNPIMDLYQQEYGDDDYGSFGELGA